MTRDKIVYTKNRYHRYVSQVEGIEISIRQSGTNSGSVYSFIYPYNGWIVDCKTVGFILSITARTASSAESESREPCTPAGLAWREKRIYSVSPQFLSAYHTRSRSLVSIPHAFLGLSQKYGLFRNLVGPRYKTNCDFETPIPYYIGG